MLKDKTTKKEHFIKKTQVNLSQQTKFVTQIIKFNKKKYPMDYFLFNYMTKKYMIIFIYEIFFFLKKIGQTHGTKITKVNYW
jgi:hypothetical protein